MAIRYPSCMWARQNKIRDRLNSHYANLDFWQQAIVFTTKGTPLNKAQVKYLEASLLELAKEHGRSKLQNKNQSRRPTLSEADQAEMDGYLDELLSLLPVLGVPFFESDEPPSHERKAYYLKGPDYSAKGFEANTGFIVLKQSLARATSVASMKKHVSGYYRLRQELIADRILQKTVDGYLLTKDWLFGSPSAAAAVFSGRSANGLEDWKDGSGATLKANREESTAKGNASSAESS